LIDSPTTLKNTTLNNNKKNTSCSKINSSCTDKNSITSFTNSRYSLALNNKSEDGTNCSISNLKSKSRNPIIKITTNESNKDSLNSIDMKNKNVVANQIPMSCSKNEVSNYQKYIKNVYYYFYKKI
jgi:hypothetical protein